MNLQELIKIGTRSAVAFVNKDVVWEGKKFTVSIKNELTPADVEFIYKPLAQDDSYQARQVHRCVLFGGEQMEYEAAKNLKASLLVVLMNAVRSVQNKGEVAPVKKPSLRRKKSTTS